MPQLMDRPLKERVVGAVVLVVLAVLVVPVFLDGSAEEAELVSETVSLPGQNGQPRKRQTIVLNRDRTEPVPAADGEPDTPAAAPQAAASTAESEARPAKRDETRAPEPAPEPGPVAEAGDAAAKATPPEPAPEKSAPAPAKNAEPQSSTGMWAVQLGSFSRPDNAERLAADLRGKGYAAFLSQLKGPNGPLHRVRIGPQKDRDGAEKTAARLAADGHKGQVVPHP